MTVSATVLSKLRCSCKTTVPCHYRRAALEQRANPSRRSGRENYPLQPQLQPLGQLHDEPCPHEQPRIRIILSAGFGIPPIPHFNCNMTGKDDPVIARLLLPNGALYQERRRHARFIRAMSRLAPAIMQRQPPGQVDWRTGEHRVMVTAARSSANDLQLRGLRELVDEGFCAGVQADGGDVESVNVSLVAALCWCTWPPWLMASRSVVRMV